MKSFLRWLGFIAPPTNQLPSKETVMLAAQIVSNTLPVPEPQIDEQTNVDIAAVSKVMVVLERQLAEVATDVESSVVGVCKGFQGMTERAQSAINLAKSAVGPSDVGSDGDLLTKMQRVVEALLMNVKLSSDFSQEVSLKLLDLESRLKIVETTIEEVEEISNRAKLVALNGQIEAARLGDQGKAFQVVAEETKALATNAARTSDTIRSSINLLSLELNKTSSSIKVRASKDTENFNQAEASAKQLFIDLNVSSQNITQSLNQTVSIGSELRSDIAKAVMSMQFQDRVSQRIAHVIETLEVLTQRMDPMCNDVSEVVASQRCSEWMKDISSRYTMDSERQAYGHESVSATNQSDDEFSVELF